MAKINQSDSQKEFERNVKNGNALDSEKEVDYVKDTHVGGRNSIYPLYQTEVSDFEYAFLKSYLFALDTDVLDDERLLMKNLAVMGTLSNPVIIPPMVSSIDDDGKALIDNDIVYALLAFEGSDYHVTVYLKTVNLYGQEVQKHFISVVGIQQGSFKTGELAAYLRKEAVRHSYYRGKMLSVCMDERTMQIEEVDSGEFAGEGLEQIYVPDMVKNELLRFCSCVEHYDEYRMGLRFLLCGEPGTGKTKSVRSIINACKSKAAVLLVKGEIHFRKLFAFAELLQPCVICLDDLDLIVGNRERHLSPTSLSAFLQELDGFRKNDLFLLATTNDKDLIDRAASRPGRFDLLIDFSRLNKSNYADLIHTNCFNEKILDVFNEELLNKLRKKKVTGAFITNLIKQLEIQNRINPDDDLARYVGSLIELSHHGFYKKNEEKEMSFGFNGHDD